MTQENGTTDDEAQTDDSAHSDGGGGTTVSCYECGASVPTDEVGTKRVRVEEEVVVEPSPYNRMDPRYDPKTDTRVVGSSPVPVCPDCSDDDAPGGEEEPAVYTFEGPGDGPPPDDLTDDDPDDEDEWNPEPASLRDGETTDVSSHAQGNIEQIRRAERDGYLDEEDAEAAVEEIREKDDGVDL